MDIRSRKMTLLQRLSEESEPVSLQELLKKLDLKDSARSVRRWLAEMIQEGVVEKSGSRKAVKYKVVSSEEEPTHLLFSPESKRLIAQMRRPIYERNPITYVDEWIESYIPNESFYIPKKMRELLSQAGKRLRKDDMAGTYAHQIYNRLLIDLSYNSSRLEGNTYSLLETEKLLLEGKTAEGKLDEEKIMILNHKEAIRYLVDQAPRLKVSRETICTVHYLLAENLIIERQHVGKVRDQGVRVGGSAYIPYEDPKQLQAKLDLIAQKAAQIQDPYEQSFFLLVHISYLQAFMDVNKRTARLSSNIPLIQKNLVPLSFNDVSREDYTSAFITIYELQDVRPLLDLYRFSYLRTCVLYDETVKAMGFDEIRARYRTQRRELVRKIILGELKEKDISVAAAKIISQVDLPLVIEDALEDLREIDPIRIAGLGITVEDLNRWKESHKAQ